MAIIVATIVIIFVVKNRKKNDKTFKGNEWIKQEDQEISAEPEIIEIPLQDIDLLIIGIVLWLVMTVLSYKKACSDFDKIDL